MLELRKDQQLRRSVLNCLLFEDTFYENGLSISNRIASLVPQVNPEIVASLAIEARSKYNLRHAPLWIVRQMAKHNTHKHLVATTLNRVIQRADELAYFLYLYFLDPITLETEAQNSCGSTIFSWDTRISDRKEVSNVKLIKQPISSQVKKGLANAFGKFNAYNLAKYREEKGISLKDVMFLVHPKPRNEEQSLIWKKLIDGNLTAADTWEVELSAGKDKKETFERLISEGKLGALAFIRNLRGMIDAGVTKDVLIHGFDTIKFDKVLPYRFITAQKFAPSMGEMLEKAMFKCLENKDRLSGRTVLLVDVSGSMNAPLTQKRFSRQKETTRIDVACGIGLLLREICENVAVFSFSSDIASVDNRLRGFSLANAINHSQSHNATYLAKALGVINNKIREYDRIIIITDEQAQDKNVVTKAKVDKAYVINVAPEKEGIEEDKGYKVIHGFSDAVVDYLVSLEKENESNWETKLDDIIVSLTGGINAPISLI